MIKKKIFIKGKIKTLTGLHIGAARESAEIGGMDNPIIKDPITGLPYIPGSSLKGKMRSLLEKSLGKNFNRVMHRREVKIHVCDDKNNAKNCEVCRLFGSSGKENHPARAYFRDAYLTKEWKEKMRSEDLIEVKYETAIDRITSAANPRPMERVPAGAKFDFSFVFTMYDEKDKYLLKYLFEAMMLLEDDYLGGSGTRGYGRICFKDLIVSEKTAKAYEEIKPERKIIYNAPTLKELVKLVGKYEDK